MLSLCQPSPSLPLYFYPLLAFFFPLVDLRDREMWQLKTESCGIIQTGIQILVFFSQ